MYKLPEIGGGGRGNSGNARKKTFILIGGLPLLYLSCWNGAKKLLELVAWLVLLPGPGQKLADSFLVALPAVADEFAESLSRVLIRCSNLKGRVGHIFTDSKRVESADEIS